MPRIKRVISTGPDTIMPLLAGLITLSLLGFSTATQPAANWTWEIQNMNNVFGDELQSPHVWLYGSTDTFEECLNACAQNSSCTSMDWAGLGTGRFNKCDFDKKCYFRNDEYWQPHALTGCNHTCARKAVPPPPPPPIKPALGYQPNIIFILTDDQDTRLGSKGYTPYGSLEAMPVLREKLQTEGALFNNFFVNTPICCPSRTESFTGRYYHNVGPPTVSAGNCMHVDTSPAGSLQDGLFGALTRAKYNVGVFGKVTNDQSNILNIAVEQKSMGYIDSPLDYNNYNGLTYFRHFPNGTTYTETLDQKNPKFKTVYQTTQIGNRTLEWLDSALSSSTPFFAYIGPHAPHYPAEPAPWYEGAFSDLRAPITPNYNCSSPNKTQHVRQNPPLTELANCWQNRHMRDRWSSLLSVDDILDDLFDKLEASGKLNETFIFYTSDHGYKQGQWRIGTSKQHPYETDIRVPFLARGPGIEGGQTLHEVTGNVDILPTIVDLAAGKDFIPSDVDGHSMVPLLIPEKSSASRSEPWRDHWIVEYKSVGTYYNDHSTCWAPPDQVKLCGGHMPVGPDPSTTSRDCKEGTGVGDGNCYFVDSTHSNNYRALRVINSTDNLIYIEYDPTWAWNTSDPSGSGLQWYELYDINADPYQMSNIYMETSVEKRTALHQQLVTYYNCRSTSSARSDCP